MSEEKIQELKKAINGFIWEHAPGEMTIEDAERASTAMLEAMVPGSVPDMLG